MYLLSYLQTIYLNSLLGHHACETGICSGTSQEVWTEIQAYIGV